MTIEEFPTTNKVWEGKTETDQSHLERICSKLANYGQGAKVKKYLESLINIEENIKNSGFEILVEDGLKEGGNSGVLEIKLICPNWPEIEEPIAGYSFNEGDYAAEKHLGPQDLKEAYLKAKDAALRKIGNLAVHLMKEGKIYRATDDQNNLFKKAA